LRIQDIRPVIISLPVLFRLCPCNAGMVFLTDPRTLSNRKPKPGFSLPSEPDFYSSQDGSVSALSLFSSYGKTLFEALVFSLFPPFFLVSVSLHKPHHTTDFADPFSPFPRGRKVLLGVRDCFFSPFPLCWYSPQPTYEFLSPTYTQNPGWLFV